MPLHDYQCPQCKMIMEDVLSHGDCIPTCSECNAQMTTADRLPTYSPNFKVVNGEISRYKRKYGPTGYAESKKHLDNSSNGVTIDAVPKKKL